MTTTPVLFLDVDGVINAIAPIDDPLLPFDEYISTLGEAGGAQWPIVYSPEVISALRELHESGAVEIRWLTTWGDEAPLLGDQLGLPAFEVAATPHEERFRYRRAWWKLTVVKEFRDANPGAPFIWLDDDIGDDAQARAWLSSLDEGTVLAISPNTFIGLEPSHFDFIADFVF